MNFRYRLMQFMSGRYGTDGFGYIIIVAACVVAAVNIFFRWWVLQLTVSALLIYALFRALSRNIPARRKENNTVMSWVNALRRKSDFQRQKKADPCHVYKKCPSCKAILRLPRRIGVHTTNCPKCGRQFKVTVRKS